MSAILQLKRGDQIAVALRDLHDGETLDTLGLVVHGEIAQGHKIALIAIREGETVLRLGQPIGTATKAIPAGHWVHLHNLGFNASGVERTIGTRLSNAPLRSKAEIPEFDGYLRADGSVGTRNYIGVLSSVNCSSLVTRMIAEHFRDPALLPAGVDGVVALTHKSGCSVADGSKSMDMLRRTLGGYARHPNFAGVLLVGLGCEDNQIDQLIEEEHLVLGGSLRSLVIQETGGTRTSIARGIDEVGALVEHAGLSKRQRLPVSEIAVGLQCGGSDSFSGISANPALGAAVDRLVACGGTAILSETPEIYGAENLLLERAVSREVGDKLIGLLDWWEDYTKNEPLGFDNNPSPGNKAGGLTTILEKSLGAVAKGGTTNLVDVLGYARPLEKNGLVFMDSPGFDPMSATGQVASGANLIAFTTGRGSCFGCRPAPSIKLASNSTMFRFMEEDMDVNCGVILEGEKNIDEVGEEIFRLMIDTASGNPTKSEELGYGEDEFAPWHVNAWL
ncbi:MAG: altronate dehydratase family protein [Devosia sp.]